MGNICSRCGKPAANHDQGLCPVGLHLNINSDAIERYLRTGHPRTMAIAFGSRSTSAFTGVEVTAVSVNGVSVSDAVGRVS